jgi:hypothetical protein
MRECSNGGVVLGRETPKHSEINLRQCHFVYHKSHMSFTGIEARLRSGKLEAKLLSYDMSFLLSSSMKMFLRTFLGKKSLWIEAKSLMKAQALRNISSHVASAILVSRHWRRLPITISTCNTHTNRLPVSVWNSVTPTEEETTNCRF